MFVNILTADNMYSPHDWEKLPQRLQTYLSEKRKIISAIFTAYLKSTRKFVYFEKNDQLDSLNISEVIYSKKCFYFNAKKQLFQNTLRRWTCSLVPNTAQVLMAAFLSYFCIYWRQIELENMSLIQIKNLRTVC